MTYCRNLEFEEKPNYEYLISLFDNTFNDMNFELDYEWCWHIIKKQILDDKQNKYEEEKKAYEEAKQN